MAKPVSYSVLLAGSQYLALFPASKQINEFKVCYSVLAAFEERHGRAPQAGDVYVLYKDRTKGLLSPEEFKGIEKAVGYYHRGEEDKLVQKSVMPSPLPTLVVAPQSDSDGYKKAMAFLQE